MYVFFLMTFFFFFFNDTSTTEIYTLSLHDALPIWRLVLARAFAVDVPALAGVPEPAGAGDVGAVARRSEEHTSELQSRRDLVCRLLLEKKKKKKNKITNWLVMDKWALYS